MGGIGFKADDLDYPNETDELRIIKLAGNGDPDALDFVMNKYKNLVRSVARAYYIVNGEVEDIIQEGMIGLYKAIKDFKPERNTSFKAFAFMCIKRQIISSIKASTRLKRIPLKNYISLDHILDPETGNRMADKLGLNSMEHIEDIIIEKEESEYLLKRINEDLSTFELQVINLYLMGDSYSEMSERLGKSEKSIDNAIQRIRRKLQKYNNKK